MKVDQYAKAGLPFYWRVEQAATGFPIVYTYVLDPATRTYRDSWSEEQCAGIEIVVVVSPSASKRLGRLARLLANALDAAAGPDRNADTDLDVRLQDVPLTNRRADVIVYRAQTIDLTPTRPEHVLLVVEVVSPGSETTDRGCGAARLSVLPASRRAPASDRGRTSGVRRAAWVQKGRSAFTA